MEQEQEPREYITEAPWNAEYLGRLMTWDDVESCYDMRRRIRKVKGRTLVVRGIRNSRDLRVRLAHGDIVALKHIVPTLRPHHLTWEYRPNSNVVSFARWNAATGRLVFSRAPRIPKDLRPHLEALRMRAWLEDQQQLLDFNFIR